MRTQDKMQQALRMFTEAWDACAGYPDTSGERAALDRAYSASLEALSTQQRASVFQAEPSLQPCQECGSHYCGGRCAGDDMMGG